MRFLLLMFPILLANCGMTKRNTVCEDEAIVIDQSDVDGCGLLLQLNNGNKLIKVLILIFISDDLAGVLI